MAGNRWTRRDPLVAHERAYFTPHVGGVTDMSYQTMGAIVAKACASLQADPWMGETCVVGISPELRYMVDEIMIVNANLPAFPESPGRASTSNSVGNGAGVDAHPPSVDVSVTSVTHSKPIVFRATRV